MATSDSAPPSLSAAFAKAETNRQALESQPATSPSYGASLAAVIAQYSSLLAQVDALALFSPNEGIDDAATSSLRYLTLHHTVAELVQRTPFPGPRERLSLLRSARDAYERFLALADGYGLVGGRHATMLERYREEGGAFSLVPRGGDMAGRREAKIANFRAGRALRERLAVLRGCEDDEGEEEAAVREVYLVEVRWRVQTAFEGLDSLNREVEMLSMAPEEPPGGDQGDGDGDGDEDATTRLDEPFRKSLLHKGGPLLSQQGRPLQPFTLVGSRTEMARGVFRPGHNLPSMSVEEYLAEERRRGGILEGGTDPPRVVADEDDEEAVDRETYKARVWDEFKDENRRGAGNTLNRG